LSAKGTLTINETRAATLFSVTPSILPESLALTARVLRKSRLKDARDLQIFANMIAKKRSYDSDRKAVERKRNILEAPAFNTGEKSNQMFESLAIRDSARGRYSVRQKRVRKLT
jgi:hypothetical protein